ncbi:MAG: alpha/beta hydrolase [Bacteroidales bacterium]
MRTLFTLLLLFFTFTTPYAQNPNYELIRDITYYPEAVSAAHPDISKQCVLDIYYPKEKKGFATIVWFHGGGLETGAKEIPEYLKQRGFCIIGVNYRLHPQVKSPVYIEDAAAAVAWAFAHIGRYGGDSALIFLSGHSAGGYLTSMVGLDKQWLAAHRIDANRIAGLIPFSGQMITHFTIRKERGIRDTQPVIDSLAPLFHVRADAPPLLLLTGDREKEMLGRYEENAYMARMMQLAGHKQTRLFELQGYDHNMVEPALPLLVKEVQRIVEEKILILE